VIDQKRDMTLLLVVGALMLAGIGFDLATNDAEPARAERSGSAFFERAQFCPSRILEEGAGAEVSIATASPEPVPVELEPLEDEPLELAAGSTATRLIEGVEPVAVEGFGSPVAAATSHFVDARVGRAGSVEGIGAGNCATDASRNWYFPNGDSSVATDYRLVVANPFPDEAVVQIDFLTSEGEETSAQLSEVDVASGQVEVVSVSGASVPQDLLSVRLRSARGRVIAWKALWTKPEGQPPGLEFTLGAPAPDTEWYFPAGEVSDRAQQTITVMNPNEEESSVSVALSTDEGPVQSSRLIEIAVAPQSSRQLVIPNRLEARSRNVGGISAVVSVDNGVPVVAESTTTYDDDEMSGRITEVGSADVSDRWLVAPPSLEPTTDSLVLQNPTTEETTVNVVIYDGGSEEGAGGTSPENLQGITVTPGLRVSISLEDIRGSGGSWLEVVADNGEVVAERITFNESRSDASSVMGQPDFGAPLR
jgi:P pilus assembly chaperone PapD